MPVREQRLEIASAKREFRRRARLHETCGVAGLFATAAGATAILITAPDLADQARWWSLTGLVASSALIYSGRLLRQAKGALTRIDRARAAPSYRIKGRAAVRGDVVANKYRLLRTMGEGGMGRVYEAERIADGATVALKVLHAHLTDRPEPVARFRRETEAASKLSQQRTASILDFGDADGVEFIAMERLQGEDLSARLRRVGRLSCADVLELVDQLATVLDAAVSAGIIHRDVHPRNIFLVGNATDVMDVRLLDFGACRLMDSVLGARAERSAAIVGTPGFLAPEQVSDAYGALGPHTDVFALACVAYFALCGRKPFRSEDAAQGVYEVLNHHPAPIHARLPDLPAAIDCVLAMALAQNPSDRYRSAGEFAADLRAAVTGAPCRRAVPVGAREAQTETMVH